MNKVGVVVLIVASLVFAGLGFVIGQIVQYSGSNIGTADDPVITQSYVDKVVGERVAALQTEIEDLQAKLASVNNGSGNNQSGNGDSGNNQSGNNQSGNQTADSSKHVKAVTSINVRSSANTSGSVLKTVESGEEMIYLGSENSADGAWYNVKLSDGTVGYVAGWYCSEIY